MRQETRPSCIFSRQQLLVAAVAACFTASVNALPTAPTVVNGTAGFAQSGNVLTVTNSAGAIINWQRFGIAAGETTRFIQPSASSAVLNQVVGVNGIREMSQIHGTLSSNGKVWLINPAGILVGASGVIDTAGFIASTLNMRAEDFLAGRLNFQATPGAGDVVNRGTITTPTGGSVYLVGTNVTNEAGAVITTPGGETVLAAGATVDLFDTSTPGVKVEITGTANNATNLGSIVAEAGRIGIAGTIVRNAGTLDASSVVNEGGRIFLKASQDTYVDGAGRIVSTGTKGGQVEVLGNRVAVMDQASIDVSGTNGGGTIKVGGDYQGKNPAIQNAQITYFGPEATLKANAIEVGDGGTVIVWADDTTRAYGHIEARGGATGGNGGFVETSGHRYLDVEGINVNTQAPQGQSGLWLLDPDSITVVETGANSGGNWVGGVFSSYGGDSVLTWGTINTNLYGGNVELQTGTTGTGNITFNAGTYNSTYGGGLRLWAYGGGTSTGNISFNNVSMDLAGGFSAYAGWDGVSLSYNPLFGKGNISISNSTIAADSWQVWEAGNDILVTSSQLTSSAGLIRLSTGGNLLQTGGLINAFSSVGLNAGYDSGVNYQRTLTVGGQVTGYSASLYSGGSLIINGNITANVDYVSAHAGNSYLPSTLTVNGNISSPSLVQINNDAGSISQASGTISAPTVTIDNEYSLTPAGSYVGVNVINGGTVTIDSKGPILDNNGSGTTNITATSSISLSSYGGATSGLAISTDTAGTVSSLSATAGGTFGEIAIRHQGNAPGTITLKSNAFEESSITFDATGDIILTSGSRSFTTNGCGIYLLAGGNLTTGTATFSGNPDEIGLYAANTLTIGQAINTTGWLGAGTAININQPITAPTNDLGIAAGISKSTVRTLADNNSDLTLSEFMKLPTTSAGNININSTVTATSGDVGLLAGGNITLNEGAKVIAGNDVRLELRGATSKLDINPTAGPNDTYVWAKAPSTIYLNLTNLASGGVFINGMPSMISSGSNGLFFGPGFSPASPGNGLVLTYGALAPSSIINTVTDSIIETTSDDPTIYDELPTVENIANADFLITDETIGGGDEEFGEGEVLVEGAGGDGQTKDDLLNLRKKKYAQCKG